MTALVHTRYSTYEVDTENKQVRRVIGANPPTNAIAEDGLWHQYTSIHKMYDSLFIQWVDLNPETGNPRCTRTSDVVKIEGDLGLPDMLTVNL